MTAPNLHHPLDLTVDRAASTLTIVWADRHVSIYPLAWLRANCPCASCREARLAAATDPLRLHDGPLPSAKIDSAELVGNYAIRFVWQDGHSSGIYGFASLRASCPCHECSPEGPAPLESD